MTELFKEKLNEYHRWEINKLSEYTLKSQIFDESSLKESKGTFISNCSMIYVKTKQINNHILICTNNYNEERKSIQGHLVKSLKYQYLQTLNHELNNPMNALLNLVEGKDGIMYDDGIERNDCVYIDGDKRQQLKLLIKLIKFFLKNFIWYLKVIFEINKENINDPKLEGRIKDVDLNLNTNLNYNFYFLQYQKSLFLYLNIKVLTMITIFPF